MKTSPLGDNTLPKLADQIISLAFLIAGSAIVEGDCHLPTFRCDDLRRGTLGAL